MAREPKNKETKMTPDAPGQAIAQRLQEALDQLHNDVHRVEVWAGALTGFAQPVPDYTPDEDHVLSPSKGDESEAPDKN